MRRGGRPYGSSEILRKVRRGRCPHRPCTTHPFFRKSNANSFVPLGRCGHRPLRERCGRCAQSPPTQNWEFSQNKSLAEFAARRRQIKSKSMLSGGFADRKHTSHAASVEFCPEGTKLCAQSACNPLKMKKAGWPKPSRFFHFIFPCSSAQRLRQRSLPASSRCPRPFQSGQRRRT